MNSEWIKEKDDVLQENTAQSIHQRIEELENAREQYTRRWIWELFQNALDSASNTRPLRVRIRYDGRSFLFAHDGEPFKHKEILHLIFHGSTKREREGVIGRYGTGFLTTHVISRSVRITASLNTGERFSFLLDRSGRTPTEIAASMQRSFDCLQDSLQPRGEEEPLTTFEYHVGEAVRPLVEKALEDLGIIAPFVLLFNEKLAGVEVESTSCRRRFELVDREPLIGSAEVVHIGDPTSSNVGFSYCTSVADGVKIAIPISSHDGVRWAMGAENVPRLFVAFPLFGTEDLPLPYVVNCFRGKPVEKRDGLFLRAEETPDNIQNKKYLESGWSLFAGLVPHFAGLGWRGLVNLARIQTSAGHDDWLDSAWLNRVAVEELKRSVLEAPLVETPQGIKSPRQIVFPVAPKGIEYPRYLDLVRQLYGDKVPDGEVAEAWTKQLGAWEGFGSVAELGLTAVELEDLARQVSSLGTLDRLGEELSSHAKIGPPPLPADWLVAFLSLLLDCDEQRLLDKEHLLPDQAGVLRPRAELKIDDGIDEVLKGIGMLLGKDLRSELLDSRFSGSVKGLLSALSAPAVCESISQLLISKSKNALGSQEFRQANLQFFSWLAVHRNIDFLRTFPFISREKVTTGVEKISPYHDDLLAPSEEWPASARQFVDLFPDCYIASSLYVAAVDGETWKWLADSGLFLLDPVRRGQVTTLGGDAFMSMLEQPLAAEQEDVEHVATVPDFVEIAYLDLKDKGVIDTVRSSRPKTSQFLSFIASHALPASSTALEYRSVDCQCGKSHRIYTAGWVSTLKERQWVHERKGHQGNPTAANLARYWREDASLRASVAEDRMLFFLRRLGVSASELLRDASALAENEATQMEKALVMLLNATNNNSTRIRELADIVAKDPAFIEEYEQRLKQRERIRLNQQVGISIERLFRDAFSAEDITSLGLRIERKPWGSDFCIEYDVLDDLGEVAFELTSASNDSFLIELKSTFGSAVAMSERQGEKAAECPDRFALCVVTLDAATEPSSDLIRERSRFVPNIGELLKDKVGEVAEIQTLISAAASTTAELDVLLDGNDVHYRVKEPVWSAGLEFGAFIQLLVKFFQTKPGRRES